MSNTMRQVLIVLSLAAAVVAIVMVLFSLRIMEMWMVAIFLIGLAVYLKQWASDGWD